VGEFLTERFDPRVADGWDQRSGRGGQAGEPSRHARKVLDAEMPCAAKGDAVTAARRRAARALQRAPGCAREGVGCASPAWTRRWRRRLQEVAGASSSEVSCGGGGRHQRREVESGDEGEGEEYWEVEEITRNKQEATADEGGVGSGRNRRRTAAA
jgi:hypothetical protein